MTPDLPLPPALALFIAAALLPFVQGRIRDAVLLIAPLLALWCLWSVPDGNVIALRWLGYDLVPLKGDALSRWFATVFAIMAFAGNLFALNQANRTELVAIQLYAGSALGAVFAGDLVSLFVFWEFMALASVLVIWSNGERARAAGLRYLIIHLFGGVVLMAGVAAQVLATGSTAFAAMKLGSLATWLIFAGFLLNAASPPLSAWLPDAYPTSSWSGMVVLSAFTTKTAVYVLLRGFPGTELLIWAGMIMIFYGIVYAILENDMRRILAYSIVNQVGFMLVGIGIGSDLALNGAASHAFAHILYKALLLMSAGSVLYMTGKSKCTDLGGLYQSMPITAVCGIIGALSISAFPLTSGFVTKSMINDAAGYAGLTTIWLLLAAGAAGVFLHAGIKFPWFVFFQKDSGLRPKDPPWNMRAAMILVSALCILFGIAPGILYQYLPFKSQFVPYTADHVVTQLQLLLFSGLAFFLLLGLLKRTLTITLDVDWFYRSLGPAIARHFATHMKQQWNEEAARLQASAERTIGRLDWAFRRGPLAVYATGSMAFAALLMLGFYLIVLLVTRS
jgi:multicomponent Na+:H+ antiporter subunit D